MLIIGQKVNYLLFSFSPGLTVSVDPGLSLDCCCCVRGLSLYLGDWSDGGGAVMVSHQKSNQREGSQSI